MALNKQPVHINFSQGLDTKSDPFQVTLGKFLNLQNSVFIKGGLLQKRNGYTALTSLPDDTSTFLTTFQGDLTALGTSLFAYSAPSMSWITQATLHPVSLDVLSLIKNNTNQSQTESVVASNGFVCTVYTDQDPSNLATPVYKYVVSDSGTGQNIVEPTAITSANATYGTPRVYILGKYFIIIYITQVLGIYHLSYIAVNISNPFQVTTQVDITTSITPSPQFTLAFDAIEYNNSLYIAWNGSLVSGIKMAYLSSTLSLTSAINPDPAHVGDIVTLAADAGTGAIWVFYTEHASNNSYAFARSPQLAPILAPTLIVPSPGTDVVNLTGSAQNGVLTVFYEVADTYAYDTAIPSHYIGSNTVTEAGSLGTASVVVRSVGLASKSFILDSGLYFLSVYQSPYQPTYFLCNSIGEVIAKVAYQNGRGYLTRGLPPVTVTGSLIQVNYLIKDLVQAVNKNTNIPSGNQVAGVYAQTGINLLSVTFGTDKLISAETGLNLNMTGGITWAYDGYSLTEQEFFLYPDSVEAVVSATAGSMSHQQYFYQVTYEWADNQGNQFKSSPSIPITITLAANNSVDLHIPTLRLSYKNINNPVKIVIYRWSVGQQVYYQTTSITTPLMNDPSVNYVSYNDGNSDATILGNSILYTTGGVIENVGPPAFDSVFLFDNRLWGIVSEDKNLLWYSKEVIENTPVEMSDLFTLFVSPTIGAQGSTGTLKCGAQMDDKLILFKSSAINYINGTGPDNTGANSQYSQPIFLTSTVGCSNQKSIVFTPEGLLFEFSSEAGNQIWLLRRNLETFYAGAPVEAFTQNATVQSAVNIPGTNQVRFTMSSGITLMYDYYYGQWGTFTNVPAVSSTLYQGLHSYINSFGQVFQESPGQYLDGASPVLMSFTTSWIQLAGLRGYQRAYFFYLLATYITPHKLNLQIAYDYNSAVIQQTVITPDNFAPYYGNDLLYGSGDPFGGNSNLEQWKIYLTRQRCQAFQITLTEIYDPSYGVAAGAGFTLSGLNCIAGFKKGYVPARFIHQAGSP